MDTFGCLNNTIKVASGHYVDLLNPTVEMIDIESIAAGLSKTCRFGGQCPRFYSVAEHSILATLIAEKSGVKDDGLRAILFHDAAEAYLGDMVKPLKNLIPQFSEFEQRFDDVIGKAVDVDFIEHADVIKRFDRAMLKAEKVQMWPEDFEKWQGFSDIGSHDVRLKFWEPDVAQSGFIAWCRLLGMM